jgi:hypothetical protein
MLQNAPRLWASPRRDCLQADHGDHAIAITDALTKRFAADLAYPVHALVHYQGAYAVATANVFTADGSDGRFTWATQQPTRPMMSTVLGLERTPAHRHRRTATGAPPPAHRHRPHRRPASRTPGDGPSRRAFIAAGCGRAGRWLDPSSSDRLSFAVMATGTASRHAQMGDRDPEYRRRQLHLRDRLFSLLGETLTTS